MFGYIRRGKKKTDKYRLQAVQTEQNEGALIRYNKNGSEKSDDYDLFNPSRMSLTLSSTSSIK